VTDWIVGLGREAVTPIAGEDSQRCCRRGREAGRPVWRAR